MSTTTRKRAIGDGGQKEEEPAKRARSNGEPIYWFMEMIPRRTDKLKLFPGLCKTRKGVHVPAGKTHATEIKIINNRKTSYSNEVSATEIKYCFSPVNASHTAMLNVYNDKRTVRVLIARGCKDYDGGDWFIKSVDMQKRRYHLQPAASREMPLAHSDEVVYRTLIEKHWGDFFHEIGFTDAQYEPHEFILSPKDDYTPDFYLPRLNGGCYVEIKPIWPDLDTVQRCELLSGQGHRVALLYGEPVEPFIKKNVFDEKSFRYTTETNRPYKGMYFVNGTEVLGHFFLMMDEHDENKVVFEAKTTKNTITEPRWNYGVLNNGYALLDDDE